MSKFSVILSSFLGAEDKGDGKLSKSKLKIIVGVIAFIIIVNVSAYVMLYLDSESVMAGKLMVFSIGIFDELSKFLLGE